MRGYVRQRGKTWAYTVNLGLQRCQRCQDPACGARHWIDRHPLAVCPKCGSALTERMERRSREQSGYRTRTEADTALNKVLTDVRTGVYVEASRMTVAHFLTKEWLPAIAATVRPSTLVSYTGHVEAHLVPALGSVLLQKLSGARINATYARLLRTEKSSNRKVDPKAETPPEPLPNLSPSTVRRIHATLHRALRDGVRWNMVPRNACDSADPPKARADGHDMKVWTAAQLDAFLTFVQGDRLSPFWRLLAMTGMRRGEVCGLRWSDCDLEGGRVSISQSMVSAGYQVVVNEPKTPRSRRSIALDAGTVTILKAWKRQQTSERVLWGELWTNTGYVFTQESGLPYHPTRVSAMFDNAVSKSKQPRIRLHDLRHTHASLLLAAGIHAKAMSSRLGHSNIGTTMNIYAHCIPELDEEAASLAAALLIPKQAERAQ